MGSPRQLDSFTGAAVRSVTAKVESLGSNEATMKSLPLMFPAFEKPAPTQLLVVLACVFFQVALGLCKTEFSTTNVIVERSSLKAHMIDVVLASPVLLLM